MQQRGAFVIERAITVFGIGAVWRVASVCFLQTAALVFRPGKAKREGHSAGCKQTWAGRSWQHRTSSAFPATGCRSRSCWASRRADGIPVSKLEKLSDEARKKGVLFFEREAWLNKQDCVAYFRRGGSPSSCSCPSYTTPHQQHRISKKSRPGTRSPRWPPRCI